MVTERSCVVGKGHNACAQYATRVNNVINSIVCL